MKKRIFNLSRFVALQHPTVAPGPGVVRLAADDENRAAEVFVYGDIGGWWDGVNAEEFAKQLADLDVDTLDVRLNSPGGFVFDGLAIYNAIARHTARTTIHIDGLAASIASVIAMAGDEIRISEGSSVMIHKPWSFAIGDAEAMRKEAGVLDELEEGLIDIYEARTAQKRADIVDWVAAETWFRGQKAVDNGFADVLVPAKKKGDKANAHARSALLPLFHNTPQDLRAPRDQAPAVREFERLLRDGEGVSHAQARRIASLARTLSLRDEGQHQPTTTLRDEGSDRADTAALFKQLARSIRSSNHA